MNFKKLVDQHFGGTASDLARTFSLTPAAVSYWKRVGIPPLRQIQIREWLREQSLKSPPRAKRTASRAR